MNQRSRGFFGNVIHILSRDNARRFFVCGIVFMILVNLFIYWIVVSVGKKEEKKPIGFLRERVNDEVSKTGDTVMEKKKVKKIVNGTNPNLRDMGRRSDTDYTFIEDTDEAWTNMKITLDGKEYNLLGDAEALKLMPFKKFFAAGSDDWIDKGEFYGALENRTEPLDRFKHKVAIIVPYRKRSSQMLSVLTFFRHFCRTLNHRMYLINLKDDGSLFNRGYLLNIGYQLARADDPEIDYIVLQDADIVVEHPENSYTYYHLPIQRATFVSCIYNYGGPNTFGGVTQIPNDLFDLMNGYHNGYGGYCCEDDDLHRRFWNYWIQKKKEKIKVGRPPKDNPKGKTFCVPHDRQHIAKLGVEREKNSMLLRKMTYAYRDNADARLRSGLNTIKNGRDYEVVSRQDFYGALELTIMEVVYKATKGNKRD